jgi:hypothetical protein
LFTFLKNSPKKRKFPKISEKIRVGCEKKSIKGRVFQKKFHYDPEFRGVKMQKKNIMIMKNRKGGVQEGENQHFEGNFFF